MVGRLLYLTAAWIGVVPTRCRIAGRKGYGCIVPRLPCCTAAIGRRTAAIGRGSPCCAAGKLRGQTAGGWLTGRREPAAFCSPCCAAAKLRGQTAGGLD